MEFVTEDVSLISIMWDGLVDQWKAGVPLESHQLDHFIGWIMNDVGMDEPPTVEGFMLTLKTVDKRALTERLQTVFTDLESDYDISDDVFDSALDLCRLIGLTELSSSLWMHLDNLSHSHRRRPQILRTLHVLDAVRDSDREFVVEKIEQLNQTLQDDPDQIVDPKWIWLAVQLVPERTHKNVSSIISHLEFDSLNILKYLSQPLSFLQSRGEDITDVLESIGSDEKAITEVSLNNTHSLALLMLDAGVELPLAEWFEYANLTSSIDAFRTIAYKLAESRNYATEQLFSIEELLHEYPSESTVQRLRYHELDTSIDVSVLWLLIIAAYRGGADRDDLRQFIDHSDWQVRTAAYWCLAQDLPPSQQVEINWKETSSEARSVLEFWEFESEYEQSIRAEALVNSVHPVVAEPVAWLTDIKVPRDSRLDVFRRLRAGQKVDDFLLWEYRPKEAAAEDILSPDGNLRVDTDTKLWWLNWISSATEYVRDRSEWLLISSRHFGDFSNAAIALVHSGGPGTRQASVMLQIATNTLHRKLSEEDYRLVEAWSMCDQRMQRWLYKSITPEIAEGRPEVIRQCLNQKDEEIISFAEALIPAEYDSESFLVIPRRALSDMPSQDVREHLLRSDREAPYERFAWTKLFFREWFYEDPLRDIYDDFELPGTFTEYLEDALGRGVDAGEIAQALGAIILNNFGGVLDATFHHFALVETLCRVPSLNPLLEHAAWLRSSSCHGRYEIADRISRRIAVEDDVAITEGKPALNLILIVDLDYELYDDETEDLKTSNRDIEAYLGRPLIIEVCNSVPSQPGTLELIEWKKIARHLHIDSKTENHRLTVTVREENSNDVIDWCFVSSWMSILVGWWV